MLSRSLTVALGLVIPLTAGSAQSGPEIFERMRQAYEQRMESVNDYTVVQEVMGVESTMHFEKVMVDGYPTFELKESRLAGMADVGGQEGGWDEFYERAEEFGSKATYVGREQLDGASVHVLEITDLEALGVSPGSPDEEVAFEPERARLFVEDGEWVVRRLVFEGVMETRSGRSDAEMMIDFRDFREVEGMLHPFLMEMNWTGMEAATGMSASEMEKMREQLEEMKKQLAEMPEAQRKMVEGMMKGQMEQIESMVNTGDMSIAVRVKELRVNTGG